ncbi:unnamed protein product, partial [Symbiodinium sp. KB8]
CYVSICQVFFPLIARYLQRGYEKMYSGKRTAVEGETVEEETVTEVEEESTTRRRKVTRRSRSRSTSGPRETGVKRTAWSEGFAAIGGVRGMVVKAVVFALFLVFKRYAAHAYKG